ncbi:MAG: hypothetical protein ACJ797_14440 [Ktedonobacteraceae bacterium]
MQQPPNYPNYEGWQQPQPQQTNTQYPPQQPQWQPQPQYPPPPQQYYPPPQWQQVPPPLPPPFWQQTGRPVRIGVKIASIVCFSVGTGLYLLGGLTNAPLAGLFNLVGFILIFLI